MTYIYDIILNFQKKYYEFFEWLPQDKIINIPKLAIYRVSDRDINILKNNEIQIKIDFLKKSNKNKKKIMFIVTNNIISLALLLNNEGTLLKRSSLIFEEEEEVISLSKNLKPISITYLKNIHHHNKNILRLEKEKKDSITSFIKNNNDIFTLKYLYYDYFKRESDNINHIKKSLLKELSKEWNGKQKNLYSTINILINTN